MDIFARCVYLVLSRVVVKYSTTCLDVPVFVYLLTFLGRICKHDQTGTMLSFDRAAIEAGLCYKYDLRTLSRSYIATFVVYRSLQAVIPLWI